jgi:RES domain-containing protein
MHRAERSTADYRGAMVAGGRWNPIGIPMLYTAEHLSLACLEILVHLDKSQLPRDYVWSATELPESADVFGGTVPAEVMACQTAGERWIREASRWPSGYLQ